MNKLDLDISKYSSQELCDIFDINSNIKNDELSKHLNVFRSTIISDNNMSLNEKDNINRFIDSVADKIANTFSINNSITFSSKQSNMDNSSYNHPIIENPNLQAGLNAKIYDGKTTDNKEYPSGYINPINIKTIKHQINIDSRFRSAYFNSSSSSFHYNLPETFRKVVNMSVTNFNIPLSIHSINLSNNCFTIDSSNINIDSGNYSTPFNNINFTQNSSASIIDKINKTLLQENITDISYTIDNITGKSKFTSINDSYTIDFNKNNVGDDDLITPLPLKLGWMLGFRTGSYTITPTTPLISEATVSINAPTYLYLCINDYTAAAGNNFVALYNESTISPHIIGRIQYQKLIQKNGIYNYGQDDDTFKAMRDYFGPVDIQKLNIQILNEYGESVDFNNMDWSCSISFDILYD